MQIQKRTTCPRDCPDACGLIVTLDGERVVRLQGDPEHPVTQGFICQRTSRFVDQQNSPHRLTRPLLRRHKGAEFEEVSWEAALDLAADRLQRFRDASGGASILQYRCGGSLGIMKHVGDYFFERFGPVTVKRGDVCSGAGEAAQLEDFGGFDSNDLFDIANARTIFLWGRNVFVSSIHLIPLLKQARAAGATIVLIDPVSHQTRSIADHFVQPRPGTDAAIALGIARILFETDRIDRDAESYCDHVDEFRRLAATRSVEEWAAMAGIPAVQLSAIAEAYAAGPTCSLIGWGLQRRRFGAATIRTIDALAAVSGNMGIPGGGASFYFVRRGAFDFSFARPESAPRTISEPQLGSGILSAADPPVRMAWIWAANPVAMLPDSATVATALRSREFTVVVDPFLTDSAQCADLVLPTTTFLEEDDVVGAYGHHFLGEVHPVIDPPEGVRSDHDIFRELASRLGMGAEFAEPAAVWKDRLLRRVAAAGVDREALRRGPVRNPFAPPIVFADRRFATPSGRVNLIRELPDGMLKPAAGRQLLVTALSTGRAQASQWTPESQQGPATAAVHPDAAVGFREGDLATVQTDHGALRVRLRFDPEQRREILLMDKGGWYFAGRSANALIAAEITDGGECAVYYDTPARLIAAD